MLNILILAGTLRILGHVLKLFEIVKKEPKVDIKHLENFMES